MSITNKNISSQTKKEMKMYSNGDTPMPNILARGTKINGDLETDGDIRIDGRVVGKILAKGKVVVGTEGFVEGEIKCKNIDVSGELKADVQADEMTVLKATARLMGSFVCRPVQDGAKRKVQGG
jgi:cytoskeletal protein CcmA (bactofilin family)